MRAFLCLNSILLSILTFSGCKTTSELDPPDITEDQLETKEAFILSYEENQIADPHNSDLNVEKFADRDDVRKWINYYTTRGRNEFQDYLRRGEAFKNYIGKILKRYELPTYFYYLAMIESGFKISAHSKANAVGFWQFIGPTATRYGLRINPYIDERRDPMRATIAAANYLRDLKNVFNSWFLAMAAYNAGESRVMNLIMNAGTRDYWQLCDRNILPRETRGYVPRFLAAVILGENPEKYGFLPVETAEHPKMLAVRVPSPVRLDKIAAKAGITLAKLRQYNPHIRRNYTPPSYRFYRIWVPEGASVDPSIVELATAPIQTLVPRQVKKDYRVRHGDSLSSVARKFRMSIRKLKTLNELKTTMIYVGQVLRVDERS
ncbi:MAG: transglycosylase SLT domain-containing protein [Deltaproteobacteria bacterium]|nr:transglycosylase SLT domain-containing protein [Deltaproteobacteria bacterium]